MYTKALALYSTVLATVHAPREEKGQGTLEYVGIVVIAALLVGAIVAAINPGDITAKIQEKISEILNAG
ncbi:MULTISPECIES: hypothetical protein [unclassified Aeromicrobium]|uniref:hypothetical protein n=1 Tax=unclassified Aeromicrobium TaxID=2633570 RepID=UPI00288BB853|nr:MULTISPECIES: hypothetical protein [unclassified Aeromicrobium]